MRCAGLRPGRGLGRVSRFQRPARTIASIASSAQPFQNRGVALPALAADTDALRSCRLRPRDRGASGAHRRRGRRRAGGPPGGPLAVQGAVRDQRLLPQSRADAQAVCATAWLDTGDLAYLADGELFISGRVKDRHHPRRPQYLSLRTRAGGRRISRACASGCVAVFGSPDPATGTERLVVLAETREAAPRALGSLRRAHQRVARST